MITMRDGSEVTEAQYATMTDLVKRYKKEPNKVYLEWICGSLMCDFGDIVIGIEKDGYAHS